MQTQLKIFTGIILLFTILCSCEKTIDFDGEDMEPKIVVNALLISGEKITTGIYKSRSFLSENDFFETLKNAQADLYVDDVFVETLNYEGKVDTIRKQLNYGTFSEIVFDNGRFVANTITEAGKTYRLEVSNNNMQAITCQTTVPMQVNIIDIDTFTEEIVEDWGTYNYFSVMVKFKDPGDITNYYRLQSDYIQGYALSYNYPEGTVYSDTILTQTVYNRGVDTSDPIFKNSDNEADDIVMGTPYNQYALFDDTQISGREYALKTQFYYDSYHSIEDTEHGNFVSQQITLCSLSKEYYDYLNTANYHFWFSEDFFSEPVLVYSNVIGGMGIWGSASVSTHEITTGKYPIDGKTYMTEQEYYKGRYGNYGYSSY